jgi:hypothetical protein
MTRIYTDFVILQQSVRTDFLRVLCALCGKFADFVLKVERLRCCAFFSTPHVGGFENFRIQKSV